MKIKRDHARALHALPTGGGILERRLLKREKRRKLRSLSKILLAEQTAG